MMRGILTYTRILKRGNTPIKLFTPAFSPLSTPISSQIVNNHYYGYTRLHSTLSTPEDVNENKNMKYHFKFEKLGQQISKIIGELGYK